MIMATVSDVSINDPELPIIDECDPGMNERNGLFESTFFLPNKVDASIKKLNMMGTLSFKSNIGCECKKNKEKCFKNFCINFKNDFECVNDLCSIDPKVCLNRRLMKMKDDGRGYRLDVINNESKLVAIKSFKRDQYVGEMAGTWKARTIDANELIDGYSKFGIGERNVQLKVESVKAGKVPMIYLHVCNPFLHIKHSCCPNTMIKTIYLPQLFAQKWKMYPRVVLVATKKINENDRLTCNFARTFGRKEHEEVKCVDCDNCNNIGDPGIEEVMRSEINYHETQIMKLVEKYETINPAVKKVNNISSIRAKLKSLELENLKLKDEIQSLKSLPDAEDTLQNVSITDVVKENEELKKKMEVAERALSNQHSMIASLQKDVRNKDVLIKANERKRIEQTETVEKEFVAKIKKIKLLEDQIERLRNHMGRLQLSSASQVMDINDRLRKEKIELEQKLSTSERKVKEMDMRMTSLNNEISKLKKVSEDKRNESNEDDNDGDNEQDKNNDGNSDDKSDDESNEDDEQSSERETDDEGGDDVDDVHDDKNDDSDSEDEMNDEDDDNDDKDEESEMEVDADDDESQFLTSEEIKKKELLASFLNLKGDKCSICNEIIARAKIARKQHIVRNDHLLMIRKFGNGDEMKFWREVFDGRGMDKTTAQRYLKSLWNVDRDKFEKEGVLKKEFEDIWK